MLSDILNMQITTPKPQTTKQCPFCAETILAAAVKCRHCGEFLNTERAKNLLAANTEDSQSQPGEVLFTGQPTLWAMTGAFVKGGLLLVAAITLVVLSYKIAAIGTYLFLGGLVLASIIGLVLFDRVLQIRMTNYKISSDRIEYGRGVFGRKIDNLDMFRVVDIKLHRSFFDCIVGVGTVILTTTDKSHPQFAFEKVKSSQQLYDIIKKASLSADRKTNVIHME